MLLLPGFVGGGNLPCSLHSCHVRGPGLKLSATRITAGVRDARNYCEHDNSLDYWFCSAEALKLLITVIVLLWQARNDTGVFNTQNLRRFSWHTKSEQWNCHSNYGQTQFDVCFACRPVHDQ